jgi:hypothetical protein
LAKANAAGTRGRGERCGAGCFGWPGVEGLEGVSKCRADIHAVGRLVRCDRCYIRETRTMTLPQSDAQYDAVW